MCSSSSVEFPKGEEIEEGDALFIIEDIDGHKINEVKLILKHS